MQSKNGFWITTLPLTSLNEQELLGLCAHLIWSSAVIASKVIFRLGGYLEGEKKNKAVNIWRAVYQNRWTNLCVKHWRWPFCLSIRVAYFYLLLWALLLLNYSWDFFFQQWSWKKTLHFKSVLMKSWWHMGFRVCVCARCVYMYIH